MPTYDYACKACKHEFEVFQSMSAKTLRECPECGKKTLERLIGTGAALIFKGSGFYQTDYRSESYKKAAEADTKAATPVASDAKPAADGAAKKPDAKAETKTETKAEAKPAVSKPEPAKKAKKSAAKR